MRLRLFRTPSCSACRRKPHSDSSTGTRKRAPRVIVEHFRCRRAWRSPARPGSRQDQRPFPYLEQSNPLEVPMTTTLAPLQGLSDALAALAAGAAPSLVSVRSRRSRSTGFLWRPGLIVTADEALAEEDEVTVGFAGAEPVAAKIAGRDRKSVV